VSCWGLVVMRPALRRSDLARSIHEQDARGRAEKGVGSTRFGASALFPHVISFASAACDDAAQCFHRSCISSSNVRRSDRGAFTCSSTARRSRGKRSGFGLGAKPSWAGCSVHSSASRWRRSRWVGRPRPATASSCRCWLPSPLAESAGAACVWLGVDIKREPG
jgi:hypothetical protein